MPILKPSWSSCSRSHSLKPLHPVEHLARGLQRTIGVVLLLQRRAEDGHDAVAHVGHERAAVVEDRLAHLGQVAVQRLDHALRFERLREAGEAAQVAEHDRRLAAHAAEPDAVSRGQDLVDDRLRDEAREGVAGLGALEGHREPVDARRGQDRQHAGDHGVDHGDDRAVVERELGADEHDGERQQADRHDEHEAPDSSAVSGVSTDSATTSSTLSHAGPVRSGKPSMAVCGRDGLDLGPGHQPVARGRGRVPVLQDGADTPTITSLPRTSAGRVGRSRRRRRDVLQGSRRPWIVDPRELAVGSAESLRPSIFSAATIGKVSARRS